MDTNDAYMLDSQDELGYMRNRFITKDPDLIYLDGNSLGRLPRATINRVYRVLEHEWGGQLIRGWNQGWFDLQQKIGDKIGQLIGARPGEVIIADSTSINLYKLVMSALHLQATRRKIITDDLNFPSDVYILQGAVEQFSGKYIDMIRSADGIHGPVDQILNAMNDGTALVSLSHTAFKSGYTYDMKVINQRARELGVLAVWDLSHSIGAVPIDVQEARLDLAVGCTYKYLNGGPGAPAFLYVRKELQEQLINPISGWFGQEDLFNFDLIYKAEPNVRRFLTGTPPILSLAPIETGVDLVLEAGMKAIRNKSLSLSEYFLLQMRLQLGDEGFQVASPTDSKFRGSHVSITHPDGWRINQALIHDRRVMPDFRAPDVLRFGFTPLYTSYTDIYTAVRRLRAVMRDKLYKKYTDENRR